MTSFSFRNGKIEESHLSSLDRGFLLGDGVFDTAGVFRGRIQQRGFHVKRLLEAASKIGIAIEEKAIAQVFDHAQLEAKDGAFILRTSISRGVTERGLWPLHAAQITLVASLTPWTQTLIGQPVRLMLSTIRRNETSPASRFKTLSSLDAILAAREAQAKGCDDAVMANTKGFLACSTIANLFLVQGDTLLTPPLEDGALEGTIRALLMRKGEEWGWKVEEKSLLPDDLAQNEAAFLTNSVRVLRPVTHFENQAMRSDPRLDVLREQIWTTLLSE